MLDKRGWLRLERTFGGFLLFLFLVWIPTPSETRLKLQRSIRSCDLDITMNSQTSVKKRGGRGRLSLGGSGGVVKKKRGGAAPAAPLRRSARIAAIKSRASEVVSRPTESVVNTRDASRKRRRAISGDTAEVVTASVAPVLKKRRVGVSRRSTVNGASRRKSVSWGETQVGEVGSDRDAVAARENGKSVCGLCRGKVDAFGGMHPFIGESVQVCSKCRHGVAHRVAASRGMDCGEGGAETAGERKRNMKADVLAAVVEDMVVGMTRGEAARKEVSAAYKVLVGRTSSATVERVKRVQRYVSYEMVPVVRRMLEVMGVGIVDGRLQWPTGVVDMDMDDGMDVIRTALTANLEEMEKGCSRGDLVWRKTFPSFTIGFKEKSCKVAERLLNLIGVRVAETRCNHRRGECCVRIDGESVEEAMGHAAGWTEEEDVMDILRQVDRGTLESRYPVRGLEMDMRGASVPWEWFRDGCCVCGREKNEKTYPLRMTGCRCCARAFCSYCVVNILNDDDEYGRAVNGGYMCVVCRDDGDSAARPPSTSSSGRGELPPPPPPPSSQGAASSSSYWASSSAAAVTGSHPYTKHRASGPSSLFKLSPCAREAMSEHGVKGDTSFREVGFAMVTEHLNDAVVNGEGASVARQDQQICLSCRMQVSKTGAQGDGDGDGGSGGERQHPWMKRGAETIRCSVGGCGRVYHRECLTREEAGRIRVEVDEDGTEVGRRWVCSRHYCIECGERVGFSDAQCSTCTNMYCERHQERGWRLNPFICDECEDCVLRPR